MLMFSKLNMDSSQSTLSRVGCVGCFFYPNLSSYPVSPVSILHLEFVNLFGHRSFHFLINVEFSFTFIEDTNIFANLVDLQKHYNLKNDKNNFEAKF